MKRTSPLTTLMIATLMVVAVPAGGTPFRDEFGAVVKLIEHFYHVKHKGIPLLARAGMKTVTTAARVYGGEAKRSAEAGSVRVAYFEEQQFDSRGQVNEFRAAMQSTLSDDWMPFIQTLSSKEESQCYIFLRDAGEKFNVLVVTIERHDACVVQVNLSPKNLALLMQDPNEMGKTITDDATLTDPE